MTLLFFSVIHNIDAVSDALNNDLIIMIMNYKQD